MSDWTDNQTRVIAQRLLDQHEQGIYVSPSRLAWARDTFARAIQQEQPKHEWVIA